MSELVRRQPFVAAEYILLLNLLLFPALPLQAQGASLWEDPQNLEVLPENISPAELRATMMLFVRATGSRCSACHVGEVEADLSTYDFTLDDKRKKQRARDMLKMVATINRRIIEQAPVPEEVPVEVNCVTCHRGQAKPELIEDLLLREVEAEGVMSAMKRYRQLREGYFGSHTYDFSEASLVMVAETLASQARAEAALAFLSLNLEFHQHSIRTLITQAQVLARAGRPEEARQSLERALMVEPDNRWIQQMLERMDAAR